MNSSLELGPIERLILDYAYEDWSGLFELRPHLAEPGAQDADSRRSAFIVGLERLIDAGLIEIAMRPDPFTVPGPPVSTAEAKALIRADDEWADPLPDKPVVIFVVTEVGRRFIEKRGETA